MLKRGFSTVACIDAPYEEVIAQASSAGMAAIEVRLEKNNRMFGLTDGQIPNLLCALKTAGLFISDLAAGISVKDYSYENIKKARECVLLAEKADVQAVRVFPTNFCNKKSDYGDYDYGGMVRSLQEMCEFAAAHGRRIWIETHNEFSTGSSLKPLISDVGSPALSVIYDVMHSVEMGETPKQTVALIGDRIAHVHIKDGVPMDDPDSATFRYTALGAGVVPTGEAIQALKTVVYEGILSLEWEDAWRAELNGM